jgi:hypothetical protein
MSGLNVHAHNGAMDIFSQRVIAQQALCVTEASVACAGGRVKSH